VLKWRWPANPKPVPHSYSTEEFTLRSRAASNKAMRATLSFTDFGTHGFVVYSVLPTVLTGR